MFTKEEKEWVGSLVGRQINKLKKEDVDDETIAELFGILSKIMNNISDSEPEGDMVYCSVVDCKGDSDIALWGNSGFAGESNSFFEPKHKRYSASDIVLWDYLD